MIEFLKRLFFGSIPLAVSRSLIREPHQWKKQWGALIHNDGTSVYAEGGLWLVGVKRHDIEIYGVNFWSLWGLSPGHYLLMGAVKKWAIAA